MSRAKKWMSRLLTIYVRESATHKAGTPGRVAGCDVVESGPFAKGWTEKIPKESHSSKAVWATGLAPSFHRTRPGSCARGLVWHLCHSLFFRFSIVCVQNLVDVVRME